LAGKLPDLALDMGQQEVKVHRVQHLVLLLQVVVVVVDTIQIQDLLPALVEVVVVDRVMDMLVDIVQPD
jgi:hypothetical protein